VVCVDELSAQELAGRAGVVSEDVERLVQLGILVPGEGERPFTPGDARRVRLASACAEAGLALEGIGAAMAAGKLTLAFLDHPLFRWSGRTAETYRDLATRVGLPTSPRSWVEQSYPNLTYFNEVDKGGHFAAWEEPQLFSEEIRAAFRSLR
jgi:pimeloyl-ACP methyl ester carboxylesterase